MIMSATPTRYQHVARCCSTSAAPYQAERMVLGTIPVLHAEHRVFFPLLNQWTSLAKAQISRDYGTATEHSEACACLNLERRRL